MTVRRTEINGASRPGGEWRPELVPQPHGGALYRHGPPPEVSRTAASLGALRRRARKYAADLAKRANELALNGLDAAAGSEDLARSATLYREAFAAFRIVMSIAYPVRSPRKRRRSSAAGMPVFCVLTDAGWSTCATSDGEGARG